MSDKFDYLRMQYEEGARIIRYYVDCRYKFLQFAGYYNAAVLTVGSSQGLLFVKIQSGPGFAISLLSFFVALMGLATEFSTASYNYSYFETLREIEKVFADNNEEHVNITDFGVISHSREMIIGSKFHTVLPVHRAHKIFYIMLCIFWGCCSIWHLYLSIK